ncbi:MAG: hypothetical protein ACYCXP_00825 [Leptospirillum sp.]
MWDRSSILRIHHSIHRFSNFLACPADLHQEISSDRRFGTNPQDLEGDVPKMGLEKRSGMRVPVEVDVGIPLLEDFCHPTTKGSMVIILSIVSNALRSHGPGVQFSRDPGQGADRLLGYP